MTGLATRHRMGKPKLGRVAHPPIFHLAAELLIIFVDHLSQGDLLSLLHTCRTIQAALAHRLYKHISIPDHRRASIWPLLRILRDRPGLARMTVSLTAFPNSAVEHTSTPRAPINRWRKWRSKKGVKDDTAIFGSLLVGALDNMINLRTLKMLDFECRAFSGPLGHLRAAATHLCLTSLQVNIPEFDIFTIGGALCMRAVDRGELLYFVRQQPLLQHLGITRIPKKGSACLEENLQPTDLPHIHTLNSVFQRPSNC
ncbi:hypothetical protein FRB93_006629 [Tulasnella sp. JGI-2019a]|nr:hypothetical protein FRB93_006629 [Tulasnella sp. JGI-2019a]